MPKGYWISVYRNVRDPDKVAAYAKLAVATMGKAGAKFLVRGNPAQAYEAGQMMRCVVIEFDSVEKAIATHDSADYQEALRVLGDGAERDIRIVEGVE